MQALWGAPATDSALEVDVEARRQALQEFSDRYEDLVEVVCDAANAGNSPKFEARFESALPAYVDAYRPVRAFLISFLPPRSGDEFGWFAKFADLQTLLDADDGGLIGRIMETRAAMNDYSEHLQRLSANRE